MTSSAAARRTAACCVIFCTLSAAVGLSSRITPRAAAQPDNIVVNSIGMKFAPVPRGAFRMGSPESEPFRNDDEALHAVTISKPYLMGVAEVTQKQYARVMGKNPSYFTMQIPGRIKSKSKDSNLHPVESVTWHEAVEFCKKLGELADEKESNYTYRLPTEAEWEFACRAGKTSPLFPGEDVSSYDANFNGVAPFGKGRDGPFLKFTWPVGGYKANTFGLLDMHGNVAEWVSDWYGADYYKHSPKVDPTGPSEGTERVVRGGSWASTARACRSAARFKLPPDESAYSVGFRVVLMSPE